MFVFLRPLKLLECSMLKFPSEEPNIVRGFYLKNLHLKAEDEIGQGNFDWRRERNKTQETRIIPKSF